MHKKQFNESNIKGTHKQQQRCHLEKLSQTYAYISISKSSWSIRINICSIKFTQIQNISESVKTLNTAILLQ